MKSITRRDFLGTAALAAGAVASSSNAVDGQSATRHKLPVVISSSNGLRATARASEILRSGGRPMDAVISGVNIVEEDPEDISVGYGGLPNEAGVVELDASVMDGASGGAGAVAALQGVKTPSKVARLVMERTNHVMLVGEGAQRFAIAHGFPIEELLTDKSRKIWLQWLESRSDGDDWGPPAFQRAPEADHGSAELHWAVRHRPTGTITCLAVAADGDISGTTTTSGLAFKIPGRVGDSPIIGAGLYVDNEVGAAGSTGQGEEVIKIGGTRIVVENMRRGMSPLEACRDALERIVHRYRSQGRPAWDVYFYALNKDGAHGAASIWSTHNAEGEPKPSQYAAFDESGNSLRDCASLFTRERR